MTSTTNNLDHNITFVSLNVKGINNAVKRQKNDSYLKQLKTDDAFLQKTHLKQNQTKQFKRSWDGQLFISKFNARARGTAILIHKDIPFQSEEMISDSAGRYIIVRGHLFFNSSYYDVYVCP